MKKIAVVLTFIAVVVSLGYLLNPLDRRMFNFHDDTQAARIQQMALALKNGPFPPRLAPELSRDMGFPVFNFYAPLAYWITTGLNLAGMPVPMALKFSFLLSIAASFLSMYLLLRAFFRTLPSLLGAVVYVSSLWFAVEIFVRGNLSECWFLAVFPLALFFMVKNSRRASPLNLAAASLAISLALTSHNVLSLVSLVLFTAFALLFPGRKRNFLGVALALGLSAYFLIPAVLESRLTYASYVAELTKYGDYFLCAWQVWKAPAWEFGGAAAGCEKDGMPYLLGKIHIVLGVAGALLFIVMLIKSKKTKQYRNAGLFMLLLGAGAFFLTTYQSAFVWDLFKPVFALFQFPWRFLVFVMPSLAFFAAFLFETVSAKLPRLAGAALMIMVMAVLLFTSKKFFSKPWLSTYDEFDRTYLAKNYLTRTVAYHMAEYLPRTADYAYWRSFDTQLHPDADSKMKVTDNAPVEAADKNAYRVLTNSYFLKEVSVNKPTVLTVNIHYFPFWQITVDNNKYQPRSFDKLGRPVIRLDQPAIVQVKYAETLPERSADLMTLAAALMLCAVILYKPLWNKLIPHLK